MASSQQTISTPEAESGNARLDAQTQKRVIALALEMQRQQQDGLTAAQLEEVAAEAGIERDFVRRAVARVAAERAGGRRNWSAAIDQRLPPGLRPHRRMLLAGLGLAAGAGFLSFGLMPDALWGMAFVSAWMGWALRDKKQAMQVGAALGVAEYLVSQITTDALFTHAVAGLSLPGFLFPMVLYGGSGALGVIFRRRMEERSPRPQFQESWPPSPQ